MHPTLEAHTCHVQRVADSFLVVAGVGARYYVQNLSIHGNRDCAGGFVDPCNILLGDLPSAAGHRNLPIGIETFDIRAGKRERYCSDVQSRHEFGSIERRGNTVQRPLDVEDDAPAQPV